MHAGYRAFLKTTLIHIWGHRPRRSPPPTEAFPPSCVVPPKKLRSVTKTGADYHNYGLSSTLIPRPDPPCVCQLSKFREGGRSEILACSVLLCSLLWHLGFLSSSFIAAGVWMNELNHFQVLKLLYIKQISPPKTHNDVHIYLSFKKRIRQTCGKGSWLNVSHGERRPPGNCFQRSNN